MAIKNEDVKKMCEAMSDFIMLIVDDWAGGDDLNTYPIDSILSALKEYDEVKSDKDVKKSEIISLKARVNAFNDMHVMVAKALKVRDTLLGISKSVPATKENK